MIVNLLCVGAGGFIGAILRASSSLFLSKFSLFQAFPIATLSVNLVGSFLIGIFLTNNLILANPNLKSFLTAGLLGGLTTFSTFSFDTLMLIEHRMFFTALLNILANVVLALIACFLGSLIGRNLG